ncbi:2-oxo-4-hydroxy-4-carboxy-5-ureidoimidazoline decarboxylase [Nordella sp. HKS 07]|uniref:2-oxo-4-hydroxy-4-carboxy-5-ureidoimidazoline decarboxylase n=1 Tax=Nordella sp. HKS 07 TaxID=2712222 RepID=UPI0013E15CF7|nr:2-oxo-4-hydroxy-4-carboxy-5-ureidoimidazoline decarboxylase [Nordella sp. HKS 07]QIG49683.1 2-oxo-4-hydroxy-4-carboxy-5-ureidoimidazoline decarboxylase [Nordella sp. HKS 07]
MITLADINAMTGADFIAAFSDVAENSPWVAEAAWRKRPFASREDVVAAFERAMRAAPDAAKLALIRAHPDLATKARLTQDSTSEQAGAGLDRLSPDEFARFTALNDTYKARFGFPFIFAVKGATKEQILAAFAARIENSPEAEFETAMTQIARIFRFRLEDRISA